MLKVTAPYRKKKHIKIKDLLEDEITAINVEITLRDQYQALERVLDISLNKFVINFYQNSKTTNVFSFFSDKMLGFYVSVLIVTGLFNTDVGMFQYLLGHALFIGILLLCWVHLVNKPLVAEGIYDYIASLLIEKGILEE